ncbi:MAG: glycosyltransferase family 9 protein [Gemmatimonadaceae bacterium]|nr:glycosyltransferase family 9 protein [Gemmatimonadaceae bacterium]
MNLETLLGWRYRAWHDTVRDEVYSRLARRGATAFIRLRWPWPASRPFERPRLLLRAPGVGIGDNLMCTPVFREIKRRNPACHITLLTKVPDLFRENPNVDLVVSDFDLAERQSLRLGYDHLAPRLSSFAGATTTAAVSGGSADAPSPALHHDYAHPEPPPRPLIAIMAECVGMEFFDNQLDCAAPEVPASFRQRIAAIPRPYVVVQPQASAWTPNKSWPIAHWAEVVQALLPRFAVVEVGTEPLLPGLVSDPRFVSLAGSTSVSEFVHVIAGATLYLGPDSGGMHIANAFRVPSVVVFGGYSAPESFRYPRTVALTGPVRCAPCWLSTPCPYGVACLHRIPAAQVLAAVDALLPASAAHD